jgi:CHRD domain
VTHSKKGPVMMITMRAMGLIVSLCLATLAIAQGEARFRARLSPVAMDATMRSTVAGSGTVSARLTGSRLVIAGSFEGLLSPATIAQVHQSSVTGVRGPSIFDLTVTPSDSGSAHKGTLSGAFELTTAQAESLRKGRLYVLVDSEKAPDGNLWGWLLP